MTKKQKSEEEKIYIPDTNVFLDDSDAHEHFDDAHVVVVTEILNELDRKKNEDGSVGANARRASASLDYYSERAFLTSLDMHKDGISLGPGKGKLFFHTVKTLHPDVKKAFKDDTADHRIISAALEIQKKVIQDEKKARQQKKKVIHTRVVIISNDTILRVKARSLGLQAEKYRNTSVKNVYSGVENITLSDELIAKIQENGAISYEDVKEYLEEDTPEPYPCEFFIINQKIFTYYYNDSLVLMDDIDVKGKCIYGSICAKNDEQKLANYVLHDPDVKAVTISGTAGTGKTLLAIAAALRQENLFEKIIITRKIVGLNGQDIGFIPGDEIRKVAPYMRPIFDNIDYILSHCEGKVRTKLEALIDNKLKFKVEPLAYIRGRTFSDACIVVDEAQNLSVTDVDALITRVGNGSKIILVGDISQIDYHWMDSTHNGLSYVIDSLKTHNNSAHITLVKGERSELSKWWVMNKYNKHNKNI